MKRLCLFLVSVNFVWFGFSQIIKLESFGPNFSNPVEIVNAGDDRLFIVEKSGVIKILNADGTVNSTSFLNITSKVLSGGERGLLGLAFAPDYTISKRFYLNYINNSGNTVIARYTASANPDIASTTETILLTINQPFNNHNGGKLAFGKDGLLYIGTGDGGNGGDPGDRSQNKSNLLGKLLRIDVSGNTYSIPSTNPFSNSANGSNDPRPEIYAVGLRNPWKFAFDKVTGDLWIADVGQNKYEEINKVTNSGAPGGNYGWRCWEGKHIFNSNGNCIISGLIQPVAEYNHAGGRCSVTGGYVYRGLMFPGLIGKYIFADYCSREIGILSDTGSNWSINFEKPNITQSFTTLGEDKNGELYIAGGSKVYKILGTSLSIDENILTKQEVNLYPNPAKNNFSINLSSKFNSVNHVSIFNTHGKKIKTISKFETQIIDVPVNKLISGVYFVEVGFKNSFKIIKKLIIH